MLNFDGTGPEGKGPKTGMQKGKCQGATPKRGTMRRNKNTAQEMSPGRGLRKNSRNRRNA